MANKTYHFHVCRKDLKAPSFTEPTFVLYEDGWNDYGVWSQFLLRYVRGFDDYVDIGNVKIIVKNQVQGSIEYPQKTADFIPASFSKLSEIEGGGCSLGQDKNYYINLLKVLKTSEEVMNFLDAMSDCALYHDRYVEMSSHVCFQSLVRYDSAEQMLRTARLYVYGEGKPDLYGFSYKFHVPYNEEILLNMKFNFREDGIIHRRIYAIIGENGTGKTHLLNQLTTECVGDVTSAFDGDIPPYSKLIRVSTSFYDDYSEPKHNERCDFEYCGLRRHEVENVSNLQDLLKQRIQKAISTIKTEKRKEDGEDKLLRISEQFIAKDLIERMYNWYEIDAEEASKCIDMMSSGECNMFFMIADIIAHIRYNSLILFDEPELHMHPNAVTIFMNILYSILEEYQSFAIIATHSPLIVREILGESVYVMERDEAHPSIRNIGIESFAANLTELYEEIFSNKDVPRYYETVLDKLYKDKKSYEEVYANLRSEHLEPNLNMRLMIMNRFCKDEED